MTPKNDSSHSPRSPLAETAVQVVLALLFACLLSWPIVQIAGERGTISWFMYLFTVWAAMLALLWRIGRAIKASPPPAGQNDAR